jgi:tetratricopeptide (TPR) repeat protein
VIVQAVIERPAALPLEDALQDLATRMRQDLTPEPRARLMNMAGDLCYDEGHRERALLYFDAAIDLYLSAGRFAAGAAICEKLVRLNPQVIRARCTLAWLAIARGLDDQAARLIDEYGDAALRLERPTVAQRQLRAMAEESVSEDVLDAIAHALLKRGDPVSADRVFKIMNEPGTHTPRQYRDTSERDRAIISRLTNAWSG